MFAKLTLDSSEYESKLKDAETKAGGFGGAVKTAVSTVGKAFAVVGTAAAAATTAVVAQTRSVAEYGDTVDKMSQKMGMSAQAYQEWDAIMQHSGTSMETMKAGMKTLANAVENGNEAFQRIGLTQEQIASMSQEDLFAATIAGLQNVESETERTYLAGQLLGRGATELGALLNTSAEDTEAMRQRVHELGGVMSDDAVKASAHFKDSLQDMKTAFSGLQRNMISEFLPSITTVMDGLGNLFSGNGGLDQIKQGISEFAAKISEELPKFVKVGGEILMALVDAIIDNLPTLFQTGTDLIVTLALGVIDELPTLIEKAPEIISALVKALIQAAPKLLEAAATMIMTIINGFVSAWPQLKQAGVNLLNMVGNGIKSMLSTVVSWGRNIIQSVKDGVMQKINDAKNWGKEMINNFIGGLLEKWEALKSKVSGVASGIAGFFKHSIPTEGAFKRDDLWGAHMIENFTSGMLKQAPKLYSAADSIAGSVKDNMQIGDVRYSMSGSTRTSDSGLAAQISALREDVRNMRIYLDTGVLVGAVDEGLQTRAMTQARRALA